MGANLVLEPARRRAAVRLLGLHTVLAAALCEEGVRLQDAFWWRCALVPLVLAIGIGLRLRARPARPRVTWKDYQAAYGRAETWPKITVAGATPSVRRTGSSASVSVDLGSMG